MEEKNEFVENLLEREDFSPESPDQQETIVVEEVSDSDSTKEEAAAMNPPESETLGENPDEQAQQAETPVVDALYVAGLFGELGKKFDDKIASDAYKNQLFDKMYSELQSLKDDPYKKTLKPIFMDLIVFSDTLRNLVSKYEEQPAEENLLSSYQKLRREFFRVESHIEDLLYNYGIEPFSATQGETFNPKIQQSKKTSAVEEEQNDKKIIESLQPGYHWDEQLLRKESVHIGLKENTNN